MIKPFAVIQTHEAKIALGRNCAVSSFDHLSTGNGDITIGDDVRIAPNVTIIGGTKEFRSRDMLIVDQGEAETRGVQIGNDVLIGAGAVVLPGTRIADGVVIGAGSVVQGEIPPYVVVAGSPATTIGTRH